MTLSAGGMTIGQPMPVGFYRNMSDMDVLAIVAYLRSVKPVSHQVGKSTFKIGLPDGYGPTAAHIADARRTTSSRTDRPFHGVPRANDQGTIGLSGSEQVSVNCLLPCW